jgi:uncharacterized protein involved in exopolysaccharide biosynthesis
MVAVVAAATILGAALGGVGSLVTPPEYTSEAHVLWSPGAAANLDDTVKDDPNLIERQVTDQREVITSDAVMDSAGSVLGMDADALRKVVAVSIDKGSSLLTVSASDDTADSASAVVSAVTTSYVSYVRDNGIQAIRDRADVLQSTIDRQGAELAALNARLTDLTGQLRGVSPTSAAYGALQGEIARLDTQVGELATRSGEVVEQQESLRAAAEKFPGQAFVVRKASVPKAPSSLSLPTALVLGGALGFVLGVCIVAFWRSRSHSRTLADGAARSAV